MVHQKVPKLYFQSQFSMSKIDGIFSKKNPFKNIHLGDHLHTYAPYVLEYILVDILETYMLK